MNNTNQCPGCPHHCDINNLQCSKGRTLCAGNTETAAAHHTEQIHHQHYFTADGSLSKDAGFHLKHHREHHHPHHPHHRHFHNHKARDGHRHHRPHFAVSGSI